MPGPQSPTRRDLAEVFNNNQRLIRAFERIFDLIPSSFTETDAVIESLELSLGQEQLAFINHLYIDRLIDVSSSNKANNHKLVFSSAVNKWMSSPLNNSFEANADYTLTKEFHTAIAKVSGLSFTLPKITSLMLGEEWSVVLDSTGYMIIKPDVADTLININNTTDVRIFNRGSSITVRVLSSSSWGII